jgi:hypothetical protein
MDSPVAPVSIVETGVPHVGCVVFGLCLGHLRLGPIRVVSVLARFSVN